MKKHTLSLLKSLPIIFATIGFVSCNVEKTEDGELPEVKVEGETKLPKYDIDTPKVEVKKKEIDIPDTITIPTIELTPADEDTNDE